MFVLECIRNVIALLVLGVAFFLGFIFIQEEIFYEKDFSVSREISMSHQIVRNTDMKVNILGDDGKLKLIGWTNTNRNLQIQPINVQISTIPYVLRFVNRIRYKKWEALIFKTSDYVGMVSFFNIGYLGGSLIHFSNMKTGKTFSKQIMNPLINLPHIGDNCSFGCSLVNYYTDDFSHFQEAEIIKTREGDYISSILYDDGTTKLDIKVEISNPLSHDTITTLTPISEDTTKFYFNTKRYNLKAQGILKINEQEIDCKEAIFSMDSGRGAWPVKSGWQWVTISGKFEDNRNFGFNSGHGFSHPSSGFTEDAFFVDGKMFKIPSQLTTKEVSINEFGHSNFVFTLTEGVNSCQLLFLTRSKNDNILYIPFVKNLFEINYGIVSGFCKDEHSHNYEIKEAFGVIENKFSLW